jgi:quinol monooxygenase YgiN
VSRFAQQTRLISTKGNADKLVAKFIEAADLQRDNKSCELMVVGKSEADEDVVYVTEVWTSESAWKEARRSKAVTAWAKDMPELVAEWPASTRLTAIGGKGI